MDRKDFLILAWNRLLKPVVALALVYCCVLFMVDVFNENGPGRLITIAVLALVILFVLAQLAGQMMEKGKQKMLAGMSPKSRKNLRVAAKIVDYIAVLLLGILLYTCWQKDAVLAMILAVLLLADRIINLSR